MFTMLSPNATSLLKQGLKKYVHAEGYALS